VEERVQGSEGGDDNYAKTIEEQRGDNRQK